MKTVKAYQFTRAELAEAFRLYVVHRRTYKDGYMDKEKAAALSAEEWGERSAGFILDLMENGREAFDRLH